MNNMIEVCWIWDQLIPHLRISKHLSRSIKWKKKPKTLWHTINSELHMLKVYTFYTIMCWQCSRTFCKFCCKSGRFLLRLSSITFAAAASPPPALWKKSDACSSYCAPSASCCYLMSLEPPAHLPLQQMTLSVQTYYYNILISGLARTKLEITDSLFKMQGAEVDDWK